MKSSFSAVITAALLLLSALPARADGMLFVEKNAVDLNDARVEGLPVGQRAVLWLRNDDSLELKWNLFIEPRFSRPESGAAWVIPLPECPEVLPASPGFLEQLDLLTRPVFLEVCETSCECEAGSRGWGCGGAGGGIGELRANIGRVGTVDQVTVWDAGTLGDMEYVLVTASQGKQIPDWLEENGYGVGDSLKKFAAAEENRDLCYFAAKVPTSYDPARALPVVRFIFNTLEDPIYPLRLTATGLRTPEQTLRLTLWMIIPAKYDWNYSPESHQAGIPPCLATDRLLPESWQSCVEEFVHNGDNSNLAVTYHDSDSSFDQILEYLEDGCVGKAMLENISYLSHPVSQTCVPLEDLTSEPVVWTSEMVRMEVAAERITRFDAYLSAEAMARDLTFSKGITPGTPAAACGNDTSCYGNYCVTVDDQRFCAPPCLDKCPSGWSCRELTNGQHPTLSYACLPEEAPTPIPAQGSPWPDLKNFYFYTVNEGDHCRTCEQICNEDQSQPTGDVVSSVTAKNPPRIPAAAGLLLPALGLLLLLRRRVRSR